MDLVKLLIHEYYEVLYTWWLRYYICSTFYRYKNSNLCHFKSDQYLHSYLVTDTMNCILGQHLLIPCFLSPGENLASEGGRLLLLILIILLFELTV